MRASGQRSRRFVAEALPGKGSARVLGEFARRLEERRPDPADRSWIYVPGDQLTDAVGPLSREDPDRLGIVLVESAASLARRPYHRQRLALVLANLRHFALEQAERGVAVRHVAGRASEATLLEPVIRELGPLRMMRPAERELRSELATLVRSGAIREIPHEGWMTTSEQFERAMSGRKTWRMDGFYRHVRRETGILVSEGTPEGGRFSFDTENRKPWRGDPPAAVPPTFRVHPVTEEVGALVEREFARHPGTLDLDALPATVSDAEALWAWALRECLPTFGPYEDAMSTASTTIFHTRISPLLNLHRLLPARVVADAVATDAPLASREGFVRQVLGWREFVRHVHEATDGFRRLRDGRRPGLASSPGDGGYERWANEPWPAAEDHGPDGGARPNALLARTALPPAYWGRASGLACLDRVVDDVWREGYGHHITRLMVLGNIGTLVGVRPRELTDWFWAAYADAYDWVVEPNVLGMATFALGDLFTTKPYVSGAAYIDRMSDYCGGCAFDPRQTCPITSLYWAFLDRNELRLAGNPRLTMPLASLRKRPAATRRHDAAVLRWVRRTLEEGARLRPEDRPALPG